MRILVTGGAGFIGSNFVRQTLQDHPADEVVVLDKLTYAGRLENLRDLRDHERFADFVHADVCDADRVYQAVSGCDIVVNFAAESHVDRSIAEGRSFIDTEVVGTHTLLEAAREAGVGRYCQVSTDEVYGSVETGSFHESSPLDPSSPYSASKAGADLLVGAYVRTYGLDAVICRSSNNYGPYQYPEKLIPLCVLNALAGDKLPVYGDGRQVRDWLFVEDNCRGIDAVMRDGEPGHVYCIGGGEERENIDVVKLILEMTGRDESLIEFVRDRPGHDRRYSLATDKVRGLGWRPSVDLRRGLELTVDWYRRNSWWWEPIRSGEYRDYYEKQYGLALQ